MIAVVTSTLKPNANKSYYSFRDRVEQTANTLNSLKIGGFKKIYLIDNSPGLDKAELRILLKDQPSVEIYHVDQYQFTNKGINELLMLLYICPYLPADQAIFKISGRYVVNSLFKPPKFNDIGVKGYNFNKKNGTISTRAYWVKNVQLFEHLLNASLQEVFAYSERIVGFRSLFKRVQNIFNKHTPLFNISIELAIANTLKRSAIAATFLDELNIEGLIAGSNFREKIIE